MRPVKKFCMLFTTQNLNKLGKLTRIVSSNGEIFTFVDSK